MRVIDSVKYKMIKKYTNFVVVFVVVILVFPVLITLVSNKVNVNNKKSNIILSGKTIVVENGTYRQTMDMEYFIPCVLMAQMPLDSPIEALKAQAVVIRTYILKQMGKNNSINSRQLKLPYIEYGQLQNMWFEEYVKNNINNFGGILCNFTGIGKSISFKENSDYLYSIIEKTNLKVLKKDGVLVLPLFHETSNGKTRDGSEILGDNYEYLKSVNCKTDLQNDEYIGIKYFTMKEVQSCFKKHGIIFYKDNKEIFNDNNLDTKSFLKLVDISLKDKSNYQLIVKIGDTKIEGETFSKALGLNSTSMDIEEYESGIRITTRGVGHGFGMSLSYAKELAKDGKQWKDILKTFYDVAIVDY